MSRQDNDASPGGAEEVFETLYGAARMQRDRDHPAEEVIATYLRAVEAAPTRAEALHDLAHYCRMKGRNEEGYQYARRGLEIPQPAGGLFVKGWIYEYGLLDELAINGYWSGHQRESLDASLRLLGGTALPADQRERVAANARFALDRLPKDPNLGSAGQSNLINRHALTAERPLRSQVVGAPKVLLAILAKQKEAMLPLYLECVEALDYPKSAIVLYIRTNNNTDGTERILREWLERAGPLYADVEFDASDVIEPVQQFGEHEWNAMRYRVLGRLRNISLRRALELGCDFYFVADVDNFMRPNTLRELVALNLPIAAPLLRSMEPGRYYANYIAEANSDGYYKDCEQYLWILNHWIRGLVEAPLVNSTYLVRSDVLQDLTYEEIVSRENYITFANTARDLAIPQYVDNRQVYGYIVPGNDRGALDHALAGARDLLSPQLALAGNRSVSPGDQVARPPVVPSAVRPRMKTLIFCTAFARSQEEWNGRYVRWTQAIRRSKIAYDNVMLIDDGSDVLPGWPDVRLLTEEEPKINDLESSPFLFYHFKDRLGRQHAYNFPGWYRSFAFAGRFAAANGFEKVIHIESDSVVIGSRVETYFSETTSGWRALWCPGHGLPESAIQVIAGPAIRSFAEIEQSHPHEQLIGREFELQLPFEVVEKKFVGDRYGDFLPFVPGNAEYAVQIRDEQNKQYYWWLSQS